MLSKAEKQFISEQLSHYRLSERETAIYLELLRSGPLSVQSLSKRLRENRITVHSATTQLIKKALLAEIPHGKRRLLAAEDPDVLFRLYQIEEREFSIAKANLGYAVGLLNRMHNPSNTKPSIKHYEGVEGFKQMLEMTLSAKGEFLAIINVQLFSEHLGPQYLEDFFRRRAEKGIYSRLIFPAKKSFADAVIKKSLEYKIQVRFLSSGFDWRSGFISWNNSISLKSLSESVISCTIVENEDIVSFYRNVIFEVMWNTALPAERIKQ